MIREFSVKNFYSFKEENKVSFLVHKKAPFTDAYVDAQNGERITKILASFGPNASGKTNLMKALPFLRWFMTHSFNLKPDEKIPVQPFRFEKGAAAPAEFSVDFECGQKIYRYGLRLTIEHVLDETLLIREGKGFKYRFKRRWNEATGKHDFSTKNFGRTKGFGESVQMRKNASVLSIALQHNHEESRQIIEAWSRLNTNVQEYRREGRMIADEIMVRLLDSAAYFHDHPKYKKQAQELLTRFDLGLAGVEIEEREIGVDKEGKPDKIILPFGVHVGKDESVHKLPFFYESSGTQNLFVLLKKILPVLEEGGIAVLDEFEVDLHPHMISPLVDLFVSWKTNPLNAQLLFSCHSIDIMKQLDKYHILLVEKDEYGYSRVVRLDEFKGVRSDDNLYAKYDAGAFGAVPNL
ncbi:MAG: ATP-binding protein [Pseudomonadota bacterium]